MYQYFLFNFVDAGILFILLTLSLSHFLLWLGRKGVSAEKGHLYFAVAALSLALFGFLRSLWPGLLIPHRGLHQHFIPFLEGTLFFTCFVGTTRYLKHLTDWRDNRQYLAILTAFAALIPLASSVSLGGLYDYAFYGFYRTRMMLPVMISSAIIMVAGLAPFVRLTLIKRQYRDPFHLTVIIGIVYILVFMYEKIFSVFFHRVSPTVSVSNLFFNWQLIIPALLFSYSLSRKHNSDFKALGDLRESLELKVAERTSQLEAAQGELETLYRQRTDLFRNLAHETRTPLTLILYHLERYSSRHNLKNDEDFSVISRNIDKLSRDMTNYLDSKKLELRSENYDHRQVTDVSRLINEKGSFFKPFARDKGLDFTFEADDGIAMSVDPIAMDRVVNNLTMNAIKYTDEGFVRLTLKATGDGALLSVADSGPGLGAERIDAFNKGLPLGPSTKGYGLGLPLTKRIVEEIGGTLSIESAPGAGSTFTVSLLRQGSGILDVEPGKSVIEEAAIAVSLGETQAKDPDRERAREADLSLLVVEDHPELLELLSRELSESYRVYPAKNGADALRRLETVPIPALILSDLMMDTMDGETFFSIVREDRRYSAIPFVFLSAANAPETRIRVLEGGAVEYISKPFAMAELKARVASLINFGGAQRESMLRGAIELLSGNLSRAGGAGGSSGANRHDRLVRRCEELGLSERQSEVTLLVAEGLEYKEIAGRMGISERTVIRHVQNLYDKLGVHNKVELINRLSVSDEPVRAR
jgi:signal transduction histidine kinase/DNA-binding NarL/FixJ family response regulator